MNELKENVGKTKQTKGMSKHSNDDGNITFSMTEITPDMANDLLVKDEAARTKSDTQHRNVSGIKVSQYVADMEQGRWQPTHQGILLSDTGEVLDGRHRLIAIIQSGKTVKMPVASGVPMVDAKRIMATIDIGRGRDAATQLWIEAGVPKSRLIMATLRSELIVATGSWLREVSFSIPTLIEAWKLQRDLFAHIMPTAMTSRQTRLSPVLAPIIIYSSEEPEKSLAFAQALATGANLGTRSPILHLRTALEKYTIKRQAQELHIAITSNAIKAFDAGEQMTSYSRKDEGRQWLADKASSLCEELTKMSSRRVHKHDVRYEENQWT